MRCKLLSLSFSRSFIDIFLTECTFLSYDLNNFFLSYFMCFIHSMLFSRVLLFVFFFVLFRFISFFVVFLAAHFMISFFYILHINWIRSAVSYFLKKRRSLAQVQKILNFCRVPSLKESNRQAKNGLLLIFMAWSCSISIFQPIIFLIVFL